MPGKWLQKATKKMKSSGTEGSFTASAERKGESVGEAASKDYNKPGKQGKRARFAYLAKHNWHGKK